jgi:hypothetical protein
MSYYPNGWPEVPGMTVKECNPPNYNYRGMGYAAMVKESEILNVILLRLFGNPFWCNQGWRQNVERME